MRKGFTLIELPIAIAISAMLMLAIFFFSNSSIKTLVRSAEAARSDKCVRFVAQRLCDDIIASRGAASASSSKKLIIDNIVYEFRSGMLSRTEGDDSYNLTVNGEIKDLQFLYPSSRLIKFKILPKQGKGYEMNVYARN
jgi:prepilin-type N-terminal cleavage/methylation domain-containing protein